MPDEMPDLTNLDTSDPEAVKRLRDAYERQNTRAEAAEQEAATLRAEQRKTNVQSILNQLHAPAQLADLFPSDTDVNEDAIKTFLRDKVGLEPDVNEAWNRYQSIGSNTTPPAPPVDETEKWIAEEIDKTAKFYQRQFAPSEKEIQELNELKSKIFPMLNSLDREVSTGQREPLVKPEGFGGFLDPPVHARRARYYTGS